MTAGVQLALAAALTAALGALALYAVDALHRRLNPAYGPRARRLLLGFFVAAPALLAAVALAGGLPGHGVTGAAFLGGVAAAAYRLRTGA